MKRSLALWALLAVLSVTLCAATEYFPDGAFHGDQRMSFFYADWYSQELRGMGETSLWKARNNKDAHIYRFTWLRAWDPLVVIRLIVQKDGSGVLVVKTFKETGGAKPGPAMTNSSRQLSKEEVSEFIQSIQNASFWDQPSYNGRHGKDGAEWIMEGLEHRRYHVVTRWSPESTEERTFGTTMIGLSGLKIPQDKIY